MSRNICDVPMIDLMAATKGIRLHPVLRGDFEQFCRDHLLDERAVIEAWLLRFLEASDEERQEAAKRYGAWIAQYSQGSVLRHPGPDVAQMDAGGNVPEGRTRPRRRKRNH